MSRRSRLSAVVAGAGLSLAALVSPARADVPVAKERADTPAASPHNVGREVPWHTTLFLWDHSVSTQTLGLGRDYQSSDPTYEMTLRLAPRFYFFEDAQRSLSLRGDARLVREFTNSDTTTERGEWTFLDTELWLTYVESLSQKPGNKTDLMVRFPSLLLPTSKTSYMSGRSIGLGAGLGIDHELPLRGDGRVLSSTLLRPRAVYTYQFVNSPVATHSGLDRIRLDPEGRSLPSDQLSGSAQPQHLLNLTLRIDTSVTDEIKVISEFGLRYAYRYALPGAVEVENVSTGPVIAEAAPSPTRWDVSTLFSTGVYYQVTSYADIGVGYENLSPQLGADGRRRSFFYSPNARAFLAFVVTLDELYHHVRGESAPEPYHTAGSASPFAL